MGTGGGFRGLERREFLEWLGGGLTLALGADLLAALRGAGAAGDPWAFRPASREADLFQRWPVRTVDTQDLAAILASWRLELGGLVERPEVLTFADLLGLGEDRLADLHCVEGWSVHDVPWRGVPLSRLLDRARPRPEATHVSFHTLGGRYNESLPLAVAREPMSLLAFGAGGQTLPLEHGFPLRLVVPRLLGYKSAKYVHRLELSDRPLYGFWVQNGYGYEGEVPPERLRPGRF